MIHAIGIANQSIIHDNDVEIVYNLTCRKCDQLQINIKWNLTPSPTSL